MALFGGLHCSSDTSEIEPGSAADRVCDLIEGQEGDGVAALFLWVVPLTFVFIGAALSRNQQRARPLAGGTAGAGAWLLLLTVLPGLLPAS